MTTTETIEFNQFQLNVLSLPEEIDLFLGGGRGGGKSYALALLALRHIEQYGSKARVLYIRRTYKGVADFELLTRELFAKVYGAAARYNSADHVWRFPNGAYLELGQLETHACYAKYQGRSFTLLLGDEIGQFDSPDLLDILRSNLRGPRDMPIRVVLAANPGGPGHMWLAKRFVFKAAPWTAFNEEKSRRTWAYCPSTFAGNIFIDRDTYHDQLNAACPSDPELLRAWVDGDWTVARGAYFASVIDEHRNAVAPMSDVPGQGWDRWSTYLAHDFGSSAPSVTYLVGVSTGLELPSGQYIPPSSLVLLDELATNKPDRLNEGLGYTVPVLADLIHAFCRKWRVAPDGVADDAIFAKTGHSTGSISDEFSRLGVNFRPAKKADRITGWQVMRRLLADAGKPDKPGLYVSRACEYFWSTVPYLPRDVKRVEDVDSTGADHAADAVRYGCLRQFNTASMIEVGGV